jgi:hypothetical protein
MSLQATTSQTVGPFFKIGLQWLYRDNLVGEGVSGERVTIQGRVLRRRWIPVPGCDCGNLAGQCAREICPSGRHAGQAAGAWFQGIWSCAGEPRGDVSLCHDQAGAGAWPERQGAGAASARLGVHARSAAAAGHADLFPR